MKKILSQIFILAALLISNNINAVVARPTPIKYKMLDGRTVTVILRGDEFFNWTTTVDGYRIMQDKDGVFVYVSSLKSGSAVPTDIRVSEIGQRTREESEFLQTSFKSIGVREQLALTNKKKVSLKSSITDYPSTGIRKNLLILANFSDKTTTFTQANFNNLMNQPTYKDKGSFRDFYLENSNGAFDITTTVTVWVTVPNSYAYYSPDTKWAEFAFDAIKAADPLVDYSQFEKNGSNLYGVTIIHQGMGQETSGNPNDIWSHQGELAYYKPSTLSRTFDGVVLNSYSMQPEIYDPGKITGMGILTHEFGHLLGLPDFYDINYETDGQYDGTGSWDLMASGAYNGSYNSSTPNALDAASPAHNNPLSKEFLNWITPISLNSAQQVTLNPIISDQTVYKIKTTTTKEYFYIENRQPTGFDAALPGHGMLIYHVDSNWISSHSSANNINAGSHQGLYVKVASGNTTNTSGAPFPGAGKNMNITDESTPNLNTWLGVPLNKSITNIVEDVSGVVKFDFMSIQDGSAREFTATNYNSTTIILDWLPSISSTNVLIAYSTNPNFGDPVNGVSYSIPSTLPGGGTVIYSGSANTFNHNVLTANTTYYYKIWTNSSLSYSPSLYAQAFTDVPISTFPWFDPIGTTINNWSSIWSSGSFLEWGAEYYDSDATVVALYQNGSGAASSILTSKPLITEVSKDYRLSFKHIQPSYLTYQDSLTVLVKSVLSDSWTSLKTFKNDIPNWNYQDINLPAFSEPFQIGFKGNCDYGNGIALDSIEIIVAAPIENINYTISIMNGITPVSGAEVVFMGHTVFSNSSGDALFNNIFPSRNWEVVFVKANGFEYAIAKVKPSAASLYQINLLKSEAIAPTNFSVSVDYTDVSLSWNPVIDESFEGYAPWDSAYIKGWTLKDFDKGASGSYGSFNYPNENTQSAFVVFDGSYGGISPNFTPHSGSQMAVSFYSNNKPNNDWIISPNLLISDGDYLEFYAKSADSEIGLESFRIVYSEGLIDTTTYLPIDSVKAVPGSWTKYSYDLSGLKGKKIFVGLHCFSNDKYALLIDDIKLKNINTTSYTPDFAVSDSHTSLPETFGNIEYQISRNGFIVNTLSGFSKSSFVENVSCSNLDYSIQTNYITPSKKSIALNALSITSCRVVTVNITQLGSPIVGATVELSGIIQTTNSQGSVVFDKVSDSNHPLSVVFNGYQTINETLVIVSDTVVNREITPTVIIPEKPFNNVQIKPNPNDGNFIISNTDLPVPFNYSVYSLDGLHLFSDSVKWLGDTPVKLNITTNGTYLLKLFLGDKVVTHKIVVIN